jgi:hypothetical protein
MALRDLTLQLLGSKRWELFWEPEHPESPWWDKVRAAGWRKAGNVVKRLWLSRLGAGVGLEACKGAAIPACQASEDWSRGADQAAATLSLPAWCQVSEPMDLATILTRVDACCYATPHAYLADVARIAQVHTAEAGYEQLRWLQSG